MQILETEGPGETYEIGRKMGLKAAPGDVFALNGDLGTGKTVFAQGFAEGLGVREYVNSPTFTILSVYETGRIPLYHFDVCRIEDPEEMFEVGFDEYINGRGVCLIEWADIIEEILPEARVSVTIAKDLARGNDYRRITVEDGRS
ncbi:MAG: tRNA (adenosine(37)-N6)-threonylcarbamoyltransferase complex ATPase subunit type 1 TsaE [Lachnospiraceae bacterium]|nr:tRNA (adenosine(37)-N6)-threonylcarbamoyltransferase complex ATPase subunit type 1 TsaE [Lachnospiraceae bacterium]